MLIDDKIITLLGAMHFTTAQVRTDTGNYRANTSQVDDQRLTELGWPGSVSMDGGVNCRELWVDSGGDTGVFVFI